MVKLSSYGLLHEKYITMAYSADWPESCPVKLLVHHPLFKDERTWLALLQG